MKRYLYILFTVFFTGLMLVVAVSPARADNGHYETLGDLTIWVPNSSSTGTNTTGTTSSTATTPSAVLNEDYIAKFLKEIKDKLEGPSTSSTVHNMAKTLFYVLAILEIFLAIYDFVTSGESTFHGWAALIIRQMLVLGFFWWLINNASTFLANIMEWFKQSGTAAGGITLNDLTVSNIAERGKTLAAALMNKGAGLGGWSNLGVMTIVGTLACLVPSFCVVFSFAIMTLTYISITVQAYFAVIIGMFVVGTGGSRLTRDIATNGIRTIAGIGLKLFTILLLIGIALNLSQNWVDAIDKINNEFDPILEFAIKISCVSLILAGMIRELPGFAAGFISGNAASGGSASTFSATMMSMMSTARMAMNTARTTTNVATTAARPVGAVLGGNFGAHPINTVKESFVRSEFAQQGGAWGALSRHSSQKQNTQPRDGIGNGPPPQDKT